MVSEPSRAKASIDASGPQQPNRRLLADIRPLQASAEFRRLWVGQSLSGMGSQMTRVAVVVQVYDVTQSSLAVGMVGLAAVVPAIVFGVLGGGLIDAFDRRKVVVITSGLLSVLAIMFASQAFLNIDSVWLLYSLVAVQSALTAIDGPARRSFIARLLPTELLPAAASLLQLSFQISLLVGPMVGGLVIAYGGLDIAYLIDALSFLIALYAVICMRPMPVAIGGKVLGFEAVFDGMRFIFREPILAAVLLVDVCAMVLAMPRALIPAIAVDQFGGGSELIGFLFAAPAIGGLVAAVLSGPLSDVQRQGGAIIITGMIWALPTPRSVLSRIVGPP